VPRAIPYKPLTMSSKPFTRSMTAALTQAHVADQVANPIPAHFYDEKEIHAIADELVERARIQFDAQLTIAYQEMINAMMHDRTVTSGSIEVHVSLEGSYDHKYDIVYTRDCLEDDSDDSECDCCASIEPEPEPEPAPVKCPYSEFEYRVVTLPPRQSQRIKAMRRKAIEAEIGADKFSQWCATIRAYLTDVETAQCETGYTRQANQLKATIANYKYLLEAPESSAILRTFPQTIMITRLKAEDLREHCYVMLNHMHAKCGCHNSYTRAQEDEFETLTNELISVCGAYLDQYRSIAK
jgi:hypothetical protein